MKNTYKVFVSSTYEDLQKERSAAREAINSTECLPVGMELFPSSDKSSWKIIEENISQSDFYVLVVGGRYGSIDKETGISYTEREYRYAVEKKIPILIFLRLNINRLSKKKIDDREKIERFRENLKNSGRHVNFYKSTGELKFQIRNSLDAKIKEENNKRTKSEYEYLIELIDSLQNQINHLAEASLNNAINLVRTNEKIRNLKKNNNLK